MIHTTENLWNSLFISNPKYYFYKSNKSRSFKTHTFKVPTSETNVVNSISNIKPAMNTPTNHTMHNYYLRKHSLITRIFKPELTTWIDNFIIIYVLLYWLY